MSQVTEETNVGTESSADALPSLLARLRLAAPVVGWVFGMGVGLMSYQNGDLLDAALRGGAVWALSIMVWTVGLTICERLLAPEAKNASEEAPKATLIEGREAPASQVASE